MIATKTKLEAAEEIAKSHFDVEPNMRRIFLLEPAYEENPREPIKLLEVMEGAIERWIEPVSFPSDPARGIPFSHMIVELSPREFARIDPASIPFRNQVWALGTEFSR